MDKQLESCLASLRDAAETVRSSGEFVDLAPYVADFSELCKGLLSDEDISCAIALVFDEESGLFSIIESLMRDKSVAKARESCWNFLAFFIEKIGSRALPYAPLLKVQLSYHLRFSTVQGLGLLLLALFLIVWLKLQEKSLKYFRRDESKGAQAAALTPLIVLLESNVTHLKPASFVVDQELTSMLMSEFRKAKATATSKSSFIDLLVLRCLKAV